MRLSLVEKYENNKFSDVFLAREGSAPVARHSLIMEV